MNFTFEGIVTELKNRLSLKSEWKKTLFYSVYQRIIDVVAYVISKFVYVAEYFLRESKWLTALNRESLVTLGGLLDYRPYRKIGSFGNIQLSADPTFSTSYTYTGETVIIYKWTRFTDEDSEINLYCTEDTTYYKYDVGYINIPVKEGIPKQYIYSAKGDDSEEIYLYSDSVDNDEIDVYIVNESDEILETVKITGRDDNPDRLYFVDDTETYYCEITNSNDFQKVIITFGNGITSRKLQANERIMIKYADTLGNEGVVQSIGVITSIVGTIYDTQNNEATLYVTNLDEISDGSDIEDIESIRQNGSYLFYAGRSCNNYKSWEIILNSHPYIHQSKLWTTDDLGDDTITSDQNKVFITAISSDGSALTTAQQNEITLNYLKDLKTPTEVVSWQPLHIIYAIFRVNATVQNLSIPIIEDQLNESLYDNYNILKTDFKENIHKSNFTRVIDENDSVVYHETEMFHMEKGFLYNTQNYTILPSLTSVDETDVSEQIYLLEDSCEIWVKNLDNEPEQVAYTSGGTFVAYNNAYVDIYLGENKYGTDPTGLANDATVYTATAAIGGGGNQTITITGSTAQTVDNLVTELQNDLTDLVVTFNDGDDYIRISVDLAGSQSVSLVDTDLISSLFSGLATILTPVDGHKYTLSNLDITYATNNISFTIDDLSATPPTEYNVSIIYKTKDGRGNQTNDVRLPKFNLITSTDDDYNQYNMSY